MTYRQKAARLEQLTKLNKDEHAGLQTDGSKNHLLWSDKEYANKELVAKFRAEVKDHYYWHQASRCCYCSMLLPPHARVYDAEHILDKSGFPEFMFHSENIAVACVLCNTHKAAKDVLLDGATRPNAIPTESEAYRILHPHLDEWNEHLAFDEVGRIVPVDGSSKGVDTIAICAMDGINFMHLANKFLPESRKHAYDLMCKVIEYKTDRKINATLSLMQGLAKQSPDALAVVQTLKDRMTQLQAQRKLEAQALAAVKATTLPKLAPTIGAAKSVGKGEVAAVLAITLDNSNGSGG